MGELTRIFLAVFSLYRLSSLISSDEGPYLSFLYKDEDQTGVFKWLRKKLGAYDKAYNEEGSYLPRSNLGRGISCPLCTSAYLGIFIVVLVTKSTKIGSVILLWLGIWGVQTFLENLTSDDAIQSAIEDVAESIGEDEDDTSYRSGS